MAFNNNALYIIMNTADPKCRNPKNVKSIFNPILNLINFMVVTSPCTHAQAGTPLSQFDLLYCKTRKFGTFVFNSKSITYSLARISFSTPISKDKNV